MEIENKEVVLIEVKDMKNEDVDICWICQLLEELNNLLRYFCVCCGFFKYVYIDCIFFWINCCRSKYCEICKCSYLIVLVYFDNVLEKFLC